MDTEHVDGPGKRGAEGGHEAIIDQPEMEIVGVEQRLGDEAFLEDGIGKGEQQERRPAASAAAHRLADEDGRAAVEGRERGERIELIEAEIAEQIFGDERREDEQEERRRGAGKPLGESGQASTFDDADSRR